MAGRIAIQAGRLGGHRRRREGKVAFARTKPYRDAGRKKGIDAVQAQARRRVDRSTVRGLVGVQPNKQISGRIGGSLPPQPEQRRRQRQ